MSRPPLDYFTAAPPETSPRLSKLAVSALTVSLVNAVLLCGPILPTIRSVVPASLQPVALLSIPVSSLLLSVVALLRILNALDDLRGEGLAIAGYITSIVVGVIALMMLIAVS